MINNELNILDEIEQLAINVSGLISVTKDACEMNDYLNEFIALEYALKLQNALIEKVVNFNPTLPEVSL